MAIFFGAYSIITLIVAYIRGRKDSLFVLLGALAVIACAVHDMLYQNNVILSDIGELVTFRPVHLAVYAGLRPCPALRGSVQERQRPVSGTPQAG